MPVDWSIPNDIVRMVMQYDRSDRMRMLLRMSVHSWDCLKILRREYYHRTNGRGGGGYGYMLDADGIEEELDDYIAWCPRAVLRAIKFSKAADDDHGRASSP